MEVKKNKNQDYTQIISTHYRIMESQYYVPLLFFEIPGNKNKAFAWLELVEKFWLSEYVVMILKGIFESKSALQLLNFFSIHSQRWWQPLTSVFLFEI